MRIDVVTIFPQYLEPMRHALLGRAIESGAIEVGVHDLRDWATDTHRSVDDRPAGGGPGMVMKPEVWGPALDDIATGKRRDETLSTSMPHKGVETVGGVVDKHEDLPLLIVPTPAGEPFTQAMAEEFSREQHVVFACGRYEGIDQRVVEDARNRYRVKEVSIGDYVLIGGEVAVLVMVEAFTRLIPGVLGNQASHEEDTFQDGLLEAPAYTQPRLWRGLEVPEVLLSGDHAKIEAYRRHQSLLRTRANRPDLLEHVELSRHDEFMLNSREISTDISVLMSQDEWEKIAPKVAKKLRRQHYPVSAMYVELQDTTCQSETILSSTEPVLRVVIHGVSDATLADATQLVVRCLGQNAQGRNIEWYGSSVEGHIEPNHGASCVWQRT